MIVRKTDTELDSMFLDRWSPRAFDKSAMPEADLRTILDAARWAPSAFNIQPWRFVYSLREDDYWLDYLSYLIPFNSSWASNASAIIFIFSDSLVEASEGISESYSHSFDAGAAWACMALQASKLGYFAHGMTGIEFNLIRRHLAVPDRFRIEAGVALGRLGDPNCLSEALRDRERPSERKSLDEIAFSGRFRSTA